MNSRLELGDHARPHPGDGALADAEHVGDHRLALALDQEPHQLLLPGFEPRHLPAQELLLLIVRLVRGFAEHCESGPLGHLHDCDVVERRKGGLPPCPPSAPPGDVDGPVMGEPLEVRSAVFGNGAAIGVKRRHGRLPVGGAGQSSEVVEHQRQRVVDRRRIANAPLAEHAADHDHHHGCGGTNQVFERGMTSGRLPLAEQGAEIDAPGLRDATTADVSTLIHECVPGNQLPAGVRSERSRDPAVARSMRSMTARLVAAKSVET